MIKEKTKNIINHIELVLLILILIASTLWTKNAKLLEKLQIVENFIIIGYIGFRNYKKKPIQLIQSKIDIFVIGLVISTIIPLIANTYISLQTTVTAILNYVTILWTYILSREISKKNKKYVQYIKNVFIMITILLIGLGIENLSTNRIFNLFGMDNIINGEKRLVSLLGNPNALASLVLFTWSISMNEMLHSKREKSRVIYATCNTIYVLGIILTYSKLVFLIFPIIIFFHFIMLKNQAQRIELFQNVLVSTILSVIYVSIFEKFIQYEYNVAILVLLIFWIGSVVIINILLEKVYKKKAILLIVIFTLIVGIWGYVQWNSKENFVVWKEGATSTYQAKKIDNIKANEKYTLCFEIEAVTKESDSFFSIRIIERDSKSLEEIQTKEITFGNFSGTKEIELVTSPDTTEIKLEFRAKNKKDLKKLEVKKFLINGKEVVVEYKHLPSKLIEKIRNIKLQYRTAQERMEFIKDGLKLISRNMLTGIGGEGWKFVYKEVQEYGYTSMDSHSYYVQVWLEFGALGIISLIGMVSFVIGKLQKRDGKEKGIQIGILAILIHVTMDLDMSLLGIKIIVFVALGMLATNSYVKEEETKISKWINRLLIVCGIMVSILWVRPEIYIKQMAIEKMEEKQAKVERKEHREYSKKIIEECDKLIQYERYHFIQNQYEQKKMEHCVQIGGKGLEEAVEKYYERVKGYKNKCNYSKEEILEKSSSITVVNKMLEEQENPQLKEKIAKLAKIVIDEYQDTQKQLEIFFKSEHKEVKQQLEYKNLVDNYNYAKILYNKYEVK